MDFSLTVLVGTLGVTGVVPVLFLWPADVLVLFPFTLNSGLDCLTEDAVPAAEAAV